MHSHDRTLLSSLAGGDPDKKDPRHDLAIQYLLDPGRLARLVRSLWNETRMIDFRNVFGTPEYIIQKGEGKYASTIGFADLLIAFEWLSPQEYKHQRSRWISAKVQREHQEIKRRWEDCYHSQLDNPDPETAQKARQFNDFVECLAGLGPEPRLDHANATVALPPEISDGRIEEQQLSMLTVALYKVLTVPLPPMFWAFDRSWEALITLRAARDHQSREKWNRLCRIALLVSDRDERIAQSIRDCNQMAQLAENQPLTLTQGSANWIDIATQQPLEGRAAEVLVEIKILPVELGAILRQFELYRAHLRTSAECLVTQFEMSTEDVQVLANKRIFHRRLGAAFEEYCIRRRQAPNAAPSPEI